VFPVPAFALKLLLGDMSVLLLGSQKLTADAALELGYSFRHPDVGEALADGRMTQVSGILPENEKPAGRR
jgi:NAD dependent epimerase/dehydratase family enzyme